MAPRVKLPLLAVALLAGLALYLAFPSRTGRETLTPENVQQPRVAGRASVELAPAERPAPESEALETPATGAGARLETAAVDSAAEDPAVEVRLYSANGGAFWEDPAVAELPAELSP